MRLSGYPRYKPSGVEWLGDVPEHWEKLSLRRISTRYTGGTPDRSNDSYWEDGTIPWINSGAVNQVVITQASAFITEEAYANSSAKWVPKGALVMALAGQGKTKGMVAQTDIATTCNQSMAVICPDASTNPRYLFWQLASQYEEIRNMAGGEQRDGLNLEILGSIPCLKVPSTEQQAIAEFLDRETGRIDLLVTRKKELIERLQEKRAALISRTVTRGLPPAATRASSLPENPTFRSSGLDELSEIPNDWRVSKVWLERVAQNLEYQDGNHGELHPKAEDYISDGIPFIMANHIVAGQIDFTICNYIEPELAASLRIGFARTGDVLLTHKGTIGRVGLVQENRFPYVVLTPQVTYYRCLRDISARYLFWFFQGRYWQDQMYLISSLGTTRGYVGLLDQRALKLILPPFAEQVIIATYLETETAKLDALAGKVERAIERLQEYRTALITAAVTGKIDVRKAAA